MMSPTAFPYILARIVEKQYSVPGTRYSEEHPWGLAGAAELFAVEAGDTGDGSDHHAGKKLHGGDVA
ncbi:MAG TPA: hypothetical protein VJQ59_07960, partial [Candidatus Sulfotelmatobacter sp.]|nr:hypothetical protein [Candidatus Sulfotelmatobacter sp.]